jgi:2-dehydro-3-deoxygluconokinase
MRVGERQGLLEARARAFDVICAGAALLRVAEEPGFFAKEPGLHFRPAGGAITAALALAARGLEVGLATVLPDDTIGRAVLAEIAASGVDVDGVERPKRARGFVLVRGGARQDVSYKDEDRPISIPEAWSSQVLFLSGVSPVVAHTAALCKAARAARRAGTIVFLDLSAKWNLWQGRDARIIQMVLREADVVWCSAQDLFGLNMDLGAVRQALRPTAVLVSSDGAARASAAGPFGEVSHLRAGEGLLPFGEGDAFAASICFELARAGHAGEGSGAMWARALQRAQASVAERTRR